MNASSDTRPDSHTIDEVRRRLFGVLDGLADEHKPMDIERARAMVDVAQTIVNTAKVQVDYLRATGGRGNAPFLEAPPAQPALPTLSAPPAAPGNGIVAVTRHFIR